ncbi:tetraacyldisaccharide 4'-kinase [Saccharospirillum impatiens]|uniref:tetraacyldisaccharide 4'-kinase n=1 Tax=Saccharospirillum impatiens TaxID=169438 RepID=UPI000428C12F|nr:tetraacyldisaccharide 4'-kinase [Saccharospirillum impatiens]
MNFWYRQHLTWLARLLIPLSWLVGAIARRRFRQRHPGNYGVPVLVVGNLSVGGTGKSPAIQALVSHLQSRGMRCGIVSRGYGGRSHHYPLSITSDTDASQCGDEPKALSQQLGCPVVVDPDRDRAVRYLVSQHSLDAVISDDGLQHYRMGRDFELVMIDGIRGLGNTRLLPAGPLREPVSRLTTVQWRVAKGQKPADLRVDGVLTLNPQWPVNAQGDLLPKSSEIRACAGIGYPEGFYRQLADQGFTVKETQSPGDHRPVSSDWLADPSLPLVLTEKDTIKLTTPWPAHCYVVRLRPELPFNLLGTIESALRSKQRWQP